jgi:hypothetical protein
VTELILEIGQVTTSVSDAGDESDAALVGESGIRSENDSELIQCDDSSENEYEFKGTRLTNEEILALISPGGKYVIFLITLSCQN